MAWTYLIRLHFGIDACKPVCNETTKLKTSVSSDARAKEQDKVRTTHVNPFIQYQDPILNVCSLVWIRHSSRRQK